MNTMHGMKTWTLVAVLGSGIAVSALVSGCGTLRSSTADPSGFDCPTCNRRVARHHPKRGTSYRRIACPSCETVRVIDAQTGAEERRHVCARCGQFVEQCPVCRGKTEAGNTNE
jgi:hypothetical protein